MKEKWMTEGLINPEYKCDSNYIKNALKPINLCVRKISNSNHSHIMQMVPFLVEFFHNLWGNSADYLF